MTEGASTPTPRGVGTPLRATRGRKTKKESKAASRRPSPSSGTNHSGHEAAPPPGFTTWWARAKAVLDVAAADQIKAVALYAAARLGGRSEEDLLAVLDGAAAKLQRPEPFRKARDLTWLLSKAGASDCLGEVEKARGRESGRRGGKRREQTGFEPSPTPW